MAGCTGSDKSTKPTLAVSIEPLRTLLSALAGDQFEVVSVMDRSSDPENFEPSPSRRLAADKASAFFMTGALPFEQQLAAALPDSVRIIRLIDSIDPIYGTHDHGDHVHASDTPDPHIWTSVRNSRIMVQEMTRALIDIDPANAAAYTERSEALMRSLQQLDDSLSGSLEAAPGAAFVVWHPSLSYFARDYGLRQVAVGTEGKEFSAAALRDAIAAAREAGAGVFVMQRGSDASRAGGVCRSAGLRLVEIDMMGADVLQQLSLTADEIARK